MNIETIRDLAGEAVGEFRDRAAANPASFARGRDALRAAEAAAERLSRHLIPRPANNPQYAPMHDAAAHMITLAATDRDTYARLLEGIVRDKAMLDPETLRGMEFLDGFLSGIGDDNEWSADLSGEGPVIRLQNDLDHHAPTLSPLSLVELVSPLLEGRRPAFRMG